MYNYKNSPHVAENRMGTGIVLVIQEGFEPPTHGLEGRCSIQLGYWTMWRLRRLLLFTGVISGVIYSQWTMSMKI